MTKKSNIFKIEVTDDVPPVLIAGAIDAALRDAEIHGTDLVVNRNGTLERLTPEEYRALLS